MRRSSFCPAVARHTSELGKMVAKLAILCAQHPLALVAGNLGECQLKILISYGLQTLCGMKTWSSQGAIPELSMPLGEDTATRSAERERDRTPLCVPRLTSRRSTRRAGSACCSDCVSIGTEFSVLLDETRPNKQNGQTPWELSVPRWSEAVLTGSSQQQSTSPPCGRNPSRRRASSGCP